MNVRKISDHPLYSDYKDYYISDEGDVISYKVHANGAKIKKTLKDKQPYYMVCLSAKGKGIKTFYIHHLVANLFLVPPDKETKILHKDGNTLNNHVSNLQWKNQDSNMISLSDGSITLTSDIAKTIHKVYGAAMMKGLKLKSKDEFVEEMIHHALNEYVRQYGLRRFL